MPEKILSLTYCYSVHNSLDIEGKIPPILPLQREGFPLFGKEGKGEIFTTICLSNHQLRIAYFVSSLKTFKTSLLISLHS